MRGRRRQPDPEPQPPMDPDPKPPVEPEPQPPVDPDPQPPVDPQPQPDPSPEPEPDPSPDPQPNPDPNPEPSPAPDPDQKPGAGQQGGAGDNQGKQEKPGNPAFRAAPCRRREMPPSWLPSSRPSRRQSPRWVSACVASKQREETVEASHLTAPSWYGPAMSAYRLLRTQRCGGCM